MKKLWLWVLVLLFGLGFLVRLYRFDNPVADWHSFRQGDTNAVSQIYVNDGINLAYPRFFDISNVPSGVYDNPEGYRFVEFPIYNVAQVIIFQGLSWTGMNLAESGRLVTILLTLLAAFFVYKLTKKYAGDLPAIFATGFYLLLPYSIYYGRTILPDPAATTSILGGIYFFDLWLSKTKGKKISLKPVGLYIAALLFTGSAFLLKPYALFFVLPMIYVAWDKFGIDFFKKWQLWLFAILSLVPLVLWRYWVGMHPEGIPQSSWLLNGNGIRFKPAFFKWMVYERLTKLILGYVGVLFLIIGTWVVFKNKKLWFFFSFALASVLYTVVIATGNVQHDYYQIYIIPAISMFAGIGAAYLYEYIAKKNGIIAIVVVGGLLCLTFFFSWKYVKDYFNINDRGMVAAGEKANEVLPKNAKIIALYDGSTTLLNISARPGWYSFQKDIEGLMKMGATHLVIANPTQNDINGFGKTYEAVASSSSYLILKLK